MQCSCGGACTERQVQENKMIVVEYLECQWCKRVLITKDLRNKGNVLRFDIPEIEVQ